jgi:hypothetical protein
MHSWRVLLLPFMDAPELYKQYRFDEPWNGPNNSKLAEYIPEGYRCPSFTKSHEHHNLMTSHMQCMTNYVAVVDPNAFFQGTTATRHKDLIDGSSNTIAVVEVRQHSVHWMQPQDITENELVFDLHSSDDANQANHINGLQMLLGDATVRFIDSKLDRKTLHGLVIRNDGAILGPF